MNFFYTPGNISPGDSVALLHEEAAHAIKVLRMREGDRINLLNGNGLRASGSITQISKTGVTAEIETTELMAAPACRLTIALAFLRKRERMEWFVEKAVEIGISHIIIFESARVEKGKADAGRLQKIALSALKQSGNYYLPEITTGVKYKALMDTSFEGDRFIAHCDDGDKQLLKNAAQPQKDTIVLIGPEGDFTPAEIQQALAKGYKPVSLGESRLRAETAALVALHTLALANQ